MPISNYLPRLTWGPKETPSAEVAAVTKPSAGQKTKAQYGAGLVRSYGCVTAPIAPFPDGYLSKCGWTWRGTYEVYAEMDRHPTLGLAKAAIATKVGMAAWSAVASDKVPASVTGFVTETLRPWRAMLLDGALDSLSYGFTPFEVVWGAIRNRWGKGLPAQLWAPVRFVPLARGSVTVLEDDNGNYVGLRTGNDDLIGPASLRFINEGNTPTTRQYGRSRHERAREYAWAPWINAARRLGKIGDKVSGTHVFITFPPEETTTQPDGTVVDNKTIAESLARDLAAGKSVYVQQSQYAFTADDFRADPNLLKVAGMTGWHVEFVDAGDAAKGQAGILEEMRYDDRLMGRAWNQPERTLFESERGGLGQGDSGVHNDLSVADAAKVGQDALVTVNSLVSAMMYFNRGEGHENDVELVAAPLIDSRKQLLKEVMTTSLSDPQFKRAWWKAADSTAIADELGIPYQGEKFNLEIEEPEPKGTNVPVKVNGNNRINNDA